MKPTKKNLSKLALTLFYLHITHRWAYTGFNVQAIHVSMPAAMDYYQQKAGSKFNKERTEILTKHGFTHESWTKVLTGSGSFYFTPTAQEDACNQDIRNLFNSYILMNGTNGLPNYTASMLKNAVRNKNPHITRQKVNGNWYYKLSDDLYTYIKNNLQL